MQLIQTVTVGAGGAASIDFTSIPQTYTDLLLVLSLRGDSDGKINFNDTTTSYSGRQLGGSGSGVFSESTTSSGRFGGFITPNANTANTFANTSVYIPNYTAAINKAISIDTVTENNGTAAYQGIQATLWSNTSAITKIVITGNSGTNHAQYSSASLYGITKGSDGIVTVS